MEATTSFRSLRAIAVLALLLCTVGLALGRPAQVRAAPVTVTSLADSGAGSLREAIATALPGDTIGFAVTGTIELTTATLTINKSLQIVGPGADQLTVQRSTLSGTPDFRIFTISAATVSISGLTISNGRAVSGAGLHISGATVSLTNCEIDGNQAVSGGFGGGVRVGENANLTITGSTLSNNTTDNEGGGLYIIGATVAIQSSTFSSNSATDFGGAIQNVIQSGETNVLTIDGSTFVGNSGNNGAVRTRNLAATGSVTTRVRSSLFSRGSGVNFTTQGTNATLVSNGNNLVTDTSSGFTNGANGDIVGSGINPQVGPLADNGGPTRTHALLVGSPALDSGVATSATDQRGRSRVADLQAIANTSDGADIGAFEHQAPLVDLNGPAAGVNFTAGYTEGQAAVLIGASTLTA